MLTLEAVQKQLDTIGYYKEFTVVFTKKDGTQRKITGFLEKPKAQSAPKQSVAVPVKVTQGEAAGQWRSFRIDSVVNLEAP